MNKLLFALFCASFGLSCHAQDVLITKDGDPIKVWGVEVSSTSVFYRENASENAPIKKISKESLLMVKYQNGEKYFFDNNKDQNVPSNSPQSVQDTGNFQVTVENLSSEAKAANETAIAKVIILNSNIDNKNAKKKAAWATATYAVKHNSVLSNEDIEIFATTGSLSIDGKTKSAKWEKGGNCTPAIQFSVKNKTNKILFVDLGTTYFTTMGKVVSYYIPSSTTTTKGTSRGASVNLGSVANAIGIGGAVGTLAGGINVGSGSSNSTVSTTYAQRVISVPPLSSIDLEAKYMFGNEDVEICKGAYLSHNLSSMHRSSTDYMPHVNFSKEVGIMLRGDQYRYTEESSPIQFNFIISYSDNESCASTKSLASYYYLYSLLGTDLPASTYLLTTQINIPKGYTALSNYIKVDNKDDKVSFPKQ